MGPRPLLTTPAGRFAATLAVLVALGTAAAIFYMWPTAELPAAQGVGETLTAEVVGADVGGDCVNLAGPGCRTLELRLEDGQTSKLPMPGGELAPPVDVGDEIRVVRNQSEGQPYAFVDFERESGLIYLVAGFVLLVVALGGFQGARALVALAGSLILVVEFIVPAILEGREPVLVALVGALGVMLVTTAVTYGVGLKSVAAILGTAVALALTAGLAMLTIESAHITGHSSEQATLLLAGGAPLSLEGLVLAGIVVGALGVLDDVTVSQASTVLALRRANPALTFRRLAADAMRVGRDHLGATVNTLVLAYAGAALPILLIFATQQTAFGEAVNREPVAAEIVAMVVGSVGLIAAMPITTLLASALAVRMPAEAPGDEPPESSGDSP